MEYRKICNVCHNIWCYTDNDIKENAKNAAVGALASLGSIASAIGGTRYDMYEMNKVSNNATNKIKDFNKCPYCNSTDIKELSEEEFKKLSKKKSSGNVGVTINSNASVDALIKRIIIFMEDEEWDEAETYCNQALDVEPDNGYLWLLKLLINVEWKFIDNRIIFNNSIRKLEDCQYYDKVQRFSKDDKNLKDKIENINNEISEYFYSKAKKEMNNAEIQSDYEKALLDLMELDNYKDSDELILECKKQIKEIREYNLQLLAEDRFNSQELSDILEAKEIYEKHKEWKDSDKILKKINKKIDEINANKEKNKKLIKKIIIITIISIIIIAIFSHIISNKVEENKKYKEATNLFENNQYEESIKIFKTLENYKDSKKKIEDANQILKGDKEVRTAIASSISEITENDIDKIIDTKEREKIKDIVKKYKKYCGIFECENKPGLLSDFKYKDGDVYWFIKNIDGSDFKKEVSYPFIALINDDYYYFFTADNKLNNDNQKITNTQGGDGYIQGDIEFKDDNIIYKLGYYKTTYSNGRKSNYTEMLQNIYKPKK